MNNFKNLLKESVSALNEQKDNTVILSGKDRTDLIVQAPIGSVPYKVKMKVPGMKFGVEDMKDNEKKQKVITAANDKINKLFADLEKEAMKVLNDAAKQIEKIG